MAAAADACRAASFVRQCCGGCVCSAGCSSLIWIHIDAQADVLQGYQQPVYPVLPPDVASSFQQVLAALTGSKVGYLTYQPMITSHIQI